VDFGLLLLSRAVVKHRSCSLADLPLSVEALSTQAQAMGAHTLQATAQELHLAKQALRLLEELASPQGETPRQVARAQVPTRLKERFADEERAKAAGIAAAAGPGEPIAALFEEWHDSCGTDSVSQNVVRSQVLQQISGNWARSDDAMGRFFRSCCEAAVKRTLADPAPPASASPADEDEAPALDFSAVDSLTQLVNVLAKKCNDKLQMLQLALSAFSKELLQDAERLGPRFNQRPYFRIFHNVLMDVSRCDPHFEQVHAQIMVAFCNVFLGCGPLTAPNFAFAWLELVSNRMFVPKLLGRKQGGATARLLLQRLLAQLFCFLEPRLRRVQLADSARKLYYGTLRTLLVLLHDFPEFLCECHFSFCDILPAPCVQIRNIILSAFPRDMRLPYPYRGLEIDQVPEIRQSPPILADYQSVLLQLNLKADVDAYARCREARLLESIKEKLRLPEEEACRAESSYNVPLMSALLLYVGMDLPKGQLSGQGAQLGGADMEIFFCLAQGLDMEGRYTFLGALANHLRYPNTHTYYFSRVLLRLFESAPEEVVQEQIIRVLLERLVVHRPHPWGLLITFIELIQDRRYDLWNHSLTRISPEITRVLGNFVNSFIGSDGSAALAGGAGGPGADGALPAADAPPA